MKIRIVKILLLAIFCLGWPLAGFYLSVFGFDITGLCIPEECGSFRVVIERVTMISVRFIPSFAVAISYIRKFSKAKNVQPQNI